MVVYCEVYGEVVSLSAYFLKSSRLETAPYVPLTGWCSALAQLIVAIIIACLLIVTQGAGAQVALELVARSFRTPTFELLLELSRELHVFNICILL